MLHEVLEENKPELKQLSPSLALKVVNNNNNNDNNSTIIIVVTMLFSVTLP